MARQSTSLRQLPQTSGVNVQCFEQKFSGHGLFARFAGFSSVWGEARGYQYKTRKSIPALF